MANSSEDKQESATNSWEKRITMIIITLLISYIASIAGDMKAQLVMIETRLTNAIDTLGTHSERLLKHEADLRNQDTRLTRVEVTIGKGLVK